MKPWFIHAERGGGLSPLQSARTYRHQASRTVKRGWLHRNSQPRRALKLGGAPLFCRNKGKRKRGRGCVGELLLLPVSQSDESRKSATVVEVYLVFTCHFWSHVTIDHHPSMTGAASFSELMTHPNVFFRAKRVECSSSTSLPAD